MHFTRELARRLAGTGVTANCLHPGVLATNFGHERRGWLSLALWIAKPFLAPAGDGGRLIEALAVSSAYAEQTGLYVSADGRPLASHAQDDAAAARLWAASERLVAG